MCSVFLFVAFSLSFRVISADIVLVNASAVGDRRGEKFKINSTHDLLFSVPLIRKTKATVVHNERNILAVTTTVTDPRSRELISAYGGLQFTASNSLHSQAWHMPQTLGGKEFYEARQLICPDEVIGYDKGRDDVLPLLHGGMTNPPRLIITARSPIDENVECQLHVKAIELASVTVKPLESRNFDTQVFELQPFKIIFGDVQRLQLHLTSDDDQCALIVVQKEGCPFATTYDLDRTLANRRHATFTRTLTLAADRDHFDEQDHFYVIFTSLPSQTACNASAVDDNNYGAMLRKKSVSMHINAGSNPSEYVLPFAMLVIYWLAICVVAGIITFQEHLRTALKNRQQSGDGCAVSVCGTNVTQSTLVEGSLPPATANLIDIASSTAGSQLSEDGEHVEAAPVAANGDEIQLDETEEEEYRLEQLRMNAESLATVEEQIRSAEPGCDPDQCLFTRMRTGVMLSSIPDSHNVAKYNSMLVTVCAFFGLPAAQMTAVLLQWRHHSHSMDVCYSNEKCHRPLGPLPSANHLLTNGLYIGFGLVGWFVIEHKRRVFNSKLMGDAVVPRTGVRLQYELISTIALVTAIQGVCSCIYHICPNETVFKLDTVFIYVIVVLFAADLYGRRHGAVAQTTAFFIVAILLLTKAAIQIIPNKTISNVAFLCANSLLLTSLSMQIYYGKQSAFSLRRPGGAWFELKRLMWYPLKEHQHWQPVFRLRWFFLTATMLINLALSLLLTVLPLTLGIEMRFIGTLMLNLVLYFLYYVVNKLRAHEGITKEAYLLLALAAFFWCFAVVFYLHNTVDFTVSAAESRLSNRACALLGFFDHHDLWHVCSASAMFFTLLLLLAIDEGLKHRSPVDILVF